MGSPSDYGYVYRPVPKVLQPIPFAQLPSSPPLSLPLHFPHEQQGDRSFIDLGQWKSSLFWARKQSQKCLLKRRSFQLSPFDYDLSDLKAGKEEK